MRDSKLLLRCSLVRMLEHVASRPVRCDARDGSGTRVESWVVEWEMMERLLALSLHESGLESHC